MFRCVTTAWVMLFALVTLASDSNWTNLSSPEYLLVSANQKATTTKGLSLASEDVNRDGTPDLIVGSATKDGGTLVVHFGNHGAIFPYSKQSRAAKAADTYSANPFLEETLTIPVSISPDFMVTGSFDADGFPDLLVGNRKDPKLLLFAGTQDGLATEPVEMPLTGSITAVTTGELSRRDGYTDLAVGVLTESGPDLLLFQGSHGGLKPLKHGKTWDVPITDLVIMHLDDDGLWEIAVSSGANLAVGRGLVEGETRWDLYPAPATITAIAPGYFDKEQGKDLALALSDGSVMVASSETLSQPPSTQKVWSEQLQIVGDTVESEQAPLLMSAYLSTQPGHTLLNLQAQSVTLWQPASSAKDKAPYVLEASVQAALPMRLTPDGLDDVVVLNAQGQLSLFATKAAATFDVNNGSTLGDGVCDSHCTLTDAIIAANASPGLDTITFIGLGTSSAGLGIFNAQEVTESVTLEGGTHVDGIVTVIGFGEWTLSGGGNTLNNMRLFELSVNVTTQGNNGIFGSIFEDSQGVHFDGASDATFGGVAAGLGNEYWGSLEFDLKATNASNVVILGNSFGAVQAYTGFNVGNGIEILGGLNITIGSPAAGNYFYKNMKAISTITNQDVLIQNNTMGIYEDLSSAAVNMGIEMADCTGCSIGGTGADMGNDMPYAFTMMTLNLTGLPMYGNSFGQVGSNANGTIEIESAGINPFFIGGSGPGEPNTFVCNDCVSTAADVRGLPYNTYRSNGLPIDLNRNGRSGNDALDVDEGPNRIQNFPVFSLTIDVDNHLQATYGISTATSNATYPLTIHFYETATSNGTGGYRLLGTDTFTETDYNGGNGKTYDFGPASDLGIGPTSRIVALATDAEGNTSEFSNPTGLPPGPYVLTVNTTDMSTDGICNSDHCSFEEALIAANNNTFYQDTIQFNIPGTGPFNINFPEFGLTSEERIIIDGTTQPGYVDEPLIFLKTFYPSRTLELEGGHSTLKGLKYDGTFEFFGGNNTVIQCWPYGTTIFNSGNNLVGGTQAADRNVLGGELVLRGSNNQVFGNYMGSGPDGATASYQLTTIEAGSTHNDIGGPNPGEANIIGGTMEIAGNHNFVQGNIMGVDASGTVPFPTQRTISITGSNNLIGGVGAEGNVIRNSETAIHLADGEGNTVIGNDISDVLYMAIDITPDLRASNTNDPLDMDMGPNTALNHPEIDQVSLSNGVMRITGMYPGAPNQTFTLQFYSNDACFSTGTSGSQNFLREITVTTGSDGIAKFDEDFTFTPDYTDVISMLTQDASGNTSEFSLCGEVPLFQDGFESGDTSSWSSTVGNLGPSGLDVMNEASNGGDFGLRASLPGSGSAYVVDTLPEELSEYRARFYLNTTGLVLSGAERFTIFQGYTAGGDEIFRMELVEQLGETILVASSKDTNNVWEEISSTLILNWSNPEIRWVGDATDGGITLWMNRDQVGEVTGQTNDFTLASVRLGAVDGVDVGTSGHLDLDDFRSSIQELNGALRDCSLRPQFRNALPGWPTSTVRDLLNALDCY